MEILEVSESCRVAAEPNIVSEKLLSLVIFSVDEEGEGVGERICRVGIDELYTLNLELSLA